MALFTGNQSALQGRQAFLDMVRHDFNRLVSLRRVRNAEVRVRSPFAPSNRS